MIRMSVFALFTFLNILPSVASADEGAQQLVGTWKLTSWVVQVIGENSREPFGPGAKGRLVITAEGHWITILTGADRRTAKTADEKAALLDSLLAYAGKYQVEGDKVTTRVDMSSNEIYTGANQDQTRFFKIEGDKLTLRTPEIASAAVPGKKVIATLNWEREH